MGHTFAAIWQGVLDVKQTWNGHKIPIDVNVAALPSPSSVVAEIAAGFVAESKPELQRRVASSGYSSSGDWHTDSPEAYGRTISSSETADGRTRYQYLVPGTAVGCSVRVTTALLLVAVCQSRYRVLATRYCVVVQLTPPRSSSAPRAPPSRRTPHRPVRHRLHQLVVAVIEVVPEVELPVAHVRRART